MTENEKIEVWLNNGGYELLEIAAKEAEKACELYREAARIDPATLHLPMTI